MLEGGFLGEICSGTCVCVCCIVVCKGEWVDDGAIRVKIDHTMWFNIEQTEHQTVPALLNQCSILKVSNRKKNVFEFPVVSTLIQYMSG